MNEQQKKHNANSLPGNAMLKHQHSFESDSTKPNIPARPFVRSNTISSTTTTTITTANKNTTLDKDVPVIAREKDQLQVHDFNKPRKIGKSASLQRPPPPNKPLLEKRQMSKSFSESNLQPNLPNDSVQNDKIVKSDCQSPPILSPTPPISQTAPESPPTHKTISTRPPPPNSKPPTRPSRPFPPPPQARIIEAKKMEAKLAKKKPPPPAPVITIIDTRSVSPPTTNEVNHDNTADNCIDNGNHGNHSINGNHDDHDASSDSNSDKPSRDLEEIKVESLNFSNIPKRPPPPAKAISQFRSVSLNSGIGATVDKNIGMDKVEEEEEEREEVLDVIQALPSSPQKSKFVNKMKSSFRSLTQRRRHSSPASRSKSTYGKPRYDEQRYPEKLPTGIVSPLVLQCVGYLNRQECLKEPGLFRIPGDMSVMKHYRACFARGEEVDLNECNDPHTIAGLLKLHFREQRVCIIPGDAIVHKIAVAVGDKDVNEFRNLIESVDVQCQAGIRILAELLKKITENSDVNHMTSGTLATSCGPSFFPRLPPSSANSILKFMTDNCDAIFGQ